MKLQTSNFSIGILDSGLGGLSVLNEIHQLMPHENLIYYGDSAWCPYGARPADEIQRRVFAVTDFLLEQNCKLIVIACNSATIAAVEALRATYPVPFVGMEPGIKPATTLTHTGTIGVLATEASLAGEKFHHLVNAHAEQIKVITRPCPEFVELVEAGKLTGCEAEETIEMITQPLLEAGADVLVLGCTHYPFLRPLIQEIVGPNIKLLDTGPAVARRVAQLLRQESATTVPQGAPDTATAHCQVFTSGDVNLLEQLFPTLCPNIPAKLAQFAIPE